MTEPQRYAASGRPIPGSGRQAEEPEHDGADVFGTVMVAILFWLGFVIARGVILSLMWSWFVRSAFAELPSLDTAHAIGLTAFVGYMRAGLVDSKPPEKTSWKEKRAALSRWVQYNVTGCGLALGLAYLFHLWMVR